MGEGTGSCPAGQWIIYLWAEAAPDTDPSFVLKKYLAKLSPDGVVFEAAYLQHRSVCSESSQAGPVVELTPYSGPHTLTEGLDWEAEQARKAFTAVVGEKEGQEGNIFFERQEDEEQDDDE